MNTKHLFHTGRVTCLMARGFFFCYRTSPYIFRITNFNIQGAFGKALV